MSDNTPKIKLTEAQKLWLGAICSKLRNGEIVSARGLKVELRGRLPRDFDPSAIDSRLLRHEDKITILGIGLLDPDNQLVKNADQVILTIRELLERRHDTEVIGVQLVSNETKLPEVDVAIIFKLLSELGIFHNSGTNYGGGVEGWGSIRIDGRAFDGYLKYESIEQILDTIVEGRSATTNQYAEDRAEEGLVAIGHPTESGASQAPNLSDPITSTNPSIDIFISHSSQDKEIAKALIKVLRNALALPDVSIRCTSVEGYKLDPGAPVEETLRREIYEAKILIGIITPASLASTYVLFELGARWGAHRPFYPALALASQSILKEPIRGRNATVCYVSSDVYDLVDKIAKILNLKVGKASAYDEDVKLLVKKSKPGRGRKPKQVTESGGGGAASTDATKDSHRAPSSTSLIDPALVRAEELNRRLDFEDEQRRWRGSEDGVNGAYRELNILFGELERITKSAAEKNPKVQIRCERAGKEQLTLLMEGVGVSVILSRGVHRYMNTLEETKLVVTTFEQRTQTNPEGRTYRTDEYEVDVDENFSPRWREKGHEGQLLTSTELANICFDFLFTAVEYARGKRKHS